VIKTLETNSFERKEEDAEMKKKSNSIKNKTILIDLEAKWRLKSKCKWKRENKKETISKKCSLKMRLISVDKKMKKKDKGSKTLRPKMNTLKCLINKKVIGETKWNNEKPGHKNSWTRWPIASLTKWTKNNNGKTRWLPDMKKRENSIKETWSKKDSIESRMTKRKCEISWINRCRKRDKENRTRRQTSTYKQRCGIKIRKITMKRKEDWKKGSNLSIRITLLTSCSRSQPKTQICKEWTELNSLWTSLFWERRTTSWRAFPSTRVVNRMAKIELIRNRKARKIKSNLKPKVNQ